MTNWKGKWIIVVAIVHTIFAFVVFGSTYNEMIDFGLIYSVIDHKSAHASWFFLFGILMLALGYLVLSHEKQDTLFPTEVVVCLLLLTTLGVIVMPASGFWLLFPPIIGMILNNRNK